MARLAFISDIHANLEALIAVLRDIDAAGVDHVVCLGDVVGYGPDPAACVELVSRVCDRIVRGNHDEAALLDAPPVNFNPSAAHSHAITRSLLSDHHRANIAAWPVRAELAGVQLTHANFGRRIHQYILNKRVAAESFRTLRELDATVGAFGHTHLPTLFACAPDPHEECDEVGSDVCLIRGSLPLPADVQTSLPTHHLILLNPGSVGQPRDGNPNASWGLLDSESQTYRTRRVSYDIDAVEDKIRARNLPDILHERLRIGA